MKIEIAESLGVLVLKEVFSGLMLETPEGNQIALCMRDGTIEYSVLGTDQWYTIDINTGESRANETCWKIDMHDSSGDKGD